MPPYFHKYKCFDRRERRNFFEMCVLFLFIFFSISRARRKKKGEKLSHHMRLSLQKESFRVFIFFSLISTNPRVHMHEYFVFDALAKKKRRPARSGKFHTLLKNSSLKSEKV
jgi:hypothetical protein